MKEKIINLVLVICFILSVSLIKNVSIVGFTNEIIGLAGLLVVLFVYNRKYR